MNRYKVHRSIFHSYRSLKSTKEEFYRGFPFLLYCVILVLSYYVIPDYFLLILLIGPIYYFFFGLFFNFYADTLLEINQVGITLKNNKEELRYIWSDIMKIEVIKDRLPDDPQKTYIIVLYLIDKNVFYFAIKNHLFVSARIRLNKILMTLNEKSSNKYQLKLNLHYSYTDSLGLFRELDRDYNVIYKPS